MSQDTAFSQELKRYHLLTRKQFCQTSFTDEDEAFMISQLSSKNSIFYFSILSCISIYRTNIQMAQVIQSILSQDPSLKLP